MRYVPGQGNPNAKLVVVGEAPGAKEEELGYPFAGASGHIVDKCLDRASEVTGVSVSRSEVYLTNVVKIRPPNNEIHRLGELHTKIEDFLPELWKEIDDIRPNCILALGGTALKALTGQTGITNYRGSILPNCHSGLPKVVASLHPAAIMHGGEGMVSWKDLNFIQFDFNRAALQSLTPELNSPKRLLHTAKSSLDFIRFWERNTGAGLRRFTKDIETVKSVPMCISFAFDKNEAISVPLFDIMSASNPTGWPLHDAAFVWKEIAQILADPQYQQIGQNLKFDDGRCESIGLPCCYPWYDIAMAWHCIYSELPKKLAFIASIITEEPYYKDELEEYNPRKDKLQKRLLYNAKDSAVEFECFEKTWELLKECDQEDFFFNFMMPLHPFYARMEKRGIRIDLEERKRLIKKYERYANIIHNQNTKDLGYELNVNSPKQVITTLYGDLGCPKRYKDGKLTTEEESLEMLMLNAVKDDRRRRIIKNTLKERKARKTLSTYVKTKLYDDGRSRTVVNICGTESGRTSNSKPKAPVVPEPMGHAFQTLTKYGDVGGDLRSMFVCSPHRCLFEADLSQAEARVVAWLADDDETLAMMNRTDFVKNKFGIKDDLHTWTTILVTGAAFETIDDEQRQIGKKTRHAGNYGMTKRRLSLLAQISEWKANQCLIRFHDAVPKVKAVYWERVQQALQDLNQVLISPHGRRRQMFEPWGEDLFREAYSHIPQATVSDHLKQAAIKIEKRMGIEVCWMESESHDSFLAEIPIETLDDMKGITKEELEKPIDFSRCSIPKGELIIPCEMMVSYTSWKAMKKVA